MASSFNRQLKFVYALVDSHVRLATEALLRGDLEFAKSLARSYGLAKRFRDSRIWYNWKCTTYENFCKKFYELCSSDFGE